MKGARAKIGGAGAFALGLSCGTPLVSTDDGDGDATSGLGTTTASDPDAASTTGDGAPETTTGGDPTDENTGASAFIRERDLGRGPIACDIWAQDCPVGQKCMPWAYDGGNAWNATKCTPLAPRPGAPGDPCKVEESAVSGLDDCDAASMCWGVDPDTGVGYCVAFCVGSWDRPTCEDPDTTCSVLNNGVLTHCYPYCSPIRQDCPLGTCAAANGGFQCTVDPASPGTYGEPCEFHGACAPGLSCAAAEDVPGCDVAGCCSSYCDLTQGDEACPGFADGQRCLPWWDNEPPPPQWRDVGYCGVPS